MFACSECVGANQTGPTLMKLTTICDVSHVISYTRPSSPLFFSGGIERKAWERGYCVVMLLLFSAYVYISCRFMGRQ